MANEENLKPFDKRTESEQREIRSKGGIASGKARRRKKTMREVAELIAEQPLTNSQLRKSIRAIASGIDEDDIDMQLAATMGLFQAAIKGNVKAFQEISYLLGGVEDVEDSESFFEAAGLD